VREFFFLESAVSPSRSNRVSQPDSDRPSAPNPPDLSSKSIAPEKSPNISLKRIMAPLLGEGLKLNELSGIIRDRELENGRIDCWVATEDPILRA
jgi:hypothetical protein